MSWICSSKLALVVWRSAAACSLSSAAISSLLCSVSFSAVASSSLAWTDNTVALETSLTVKASSSCAWMRLISSFFKSKMCVSSLISIVAFSPRARQFASALAFMSWICSSKLALVVWRSAAACSLSSAAISSLLCSVSFSAVASSSLAWIAKMASVETSLAVKASSKWARRRSMSAFFKLTVCKSSLIFDNDFSSLTLVSASVTSAWALRLWICSSKFSFMCSKLATSFSIPSMAPL